MAPSATSSWRPHPTILRVAAHAGCLVVIGAAIWLVLQVVAQLTLVLFPVAVAIFLTRVLSVPGGWLRRRGWRPAPAAATVLLGFLAVVALAVALIAPPMIEEFRDLGPTVEEGLTDIEDWLVRDAPVDVTRSELDDLKDDAADRGREALGESQDQVTQGALAVLSGLAGLLLALILTFFALKDGPALQQWATRTVPERRRDEAVTVARASWGSLGGYLRGAALLGIVEAITIGIAMTIVGSGLVLPVMLLTFVAAFVPLVGATVAGIVAVLVTLASGGLIDALIIAAVAVVVQQFDNDLLAPWIYGKALSMHPATILLSITTGTALFGFVGTVAAVPLTAVVLSSVAALRGARPTSDGDAATATGAPEPAGPGPATSGGP
ncbi:AI-2E family transporter [Iamia sp.]|uniref:AI-2E family transporter n=1 Tax=Iamia sp. TaxID=2722710 RepID=UPI002C1A85E9|nr:AI-2E family transporter [Iamia sp.]HXH59161.1 AI-2E family transporter [Iamia sp.]